MSNPAPKFGTYALPPAREQVRMHADNYGDTRMGRWQISYARKRAFKGIDDPFDINVMTGVKARLWPRSNRCEKRAFAGVQIWDAREHKALGLALDNSKTTSFVFFDVGANVGLYSLIVSARARAAGKDITIIAIEPDPTNRARLEFNAGASGAVITVLPVAISDETATGFMGGGAVNRGEVKLTETGGAPVAITTLHVICQEQNITRIDAMKVDIEGHDLKALTSFFGAAPQSLWPHLLILETGREANTPLLELCTKHGYTIQTRAEINTILTRKKETR